LARPADFRIKTPKAANKDNRRRLRKNQIVFVSRSLVEDVSKKLRSIALGIDQSVLEAVRQYRFEPAGFQGKPVPVETTLGIVFGIYRLRPSMCRYEVVLTLWLQNSGF
jgi:hypothetical protein